MYKQFLENRQELGLKKCSYSLYAAVVNENKIRFSHMTNEECELCIIFSSHEIGTGHSRHSLNENDRINCSQCDEWWNHIQRAGYARKFYQEDKLSFSEDTMIVSSDMQKLVYLPRMETLKRVSFTTRIKAINQTFAPVGSNGQVIAILWNETVSGRTGDDLISAYFAFFILNGHKTTIKVWMDNCSSQNKNWALIVNLILLINSKLIEIKNIELAYFEVGHTYMSADAFHHSVELQMKSAGKVYDYKDFVECVEKARSCTPLAFTMKPTDFFNTTITISNYQLSKIRPRPYLAEIKAIKFTRGSFSFQYSDSYDGPFTECKPFSKKQLQEVTKPGFDIRKTLNYHKEAAGIEKEQKNTILKNLGPLMPAEKTIFWRDLPETTPRSD